MNDYQIYNTALYLRLSKEDELNGQSESINNQRDFLTKYVLEQGWNIAGVYIDDGYSGLNFDRPDFKRMLADIEEKKINLVITKDLSRLGRDYIDTGYYLERYFPTKKIRYIALNDGIDTTKDGGNNDISPFKAVINDMYAKDISKKTRAAFDIKRQNGQFIGGFAPYGYKKDPHNKNKLVIDEVAGEVVKRIYSLYFNGESMGSIAKCFNDENVLSPAKYKNKTTTYKSKISKWSLWTPETIRWILTNPTYIGNLTQKRQEKINYKLQKYRNVPSDEWIIVAGTHEALIDKKDFDFVQELLHKKILHYNMPEKAVHLLNGLVFCKDCGVKMTYKRDKQKRMCVFCSTYARHGATFCSNNLISEETLENYIFNELRKVAKKSLNEGFYEQFARVNFIETNNEEKDLIVRRLSEIKNIIISLYDDKIRGIIDEELFVGMSSKFNSEKSRLTGRLVQIESQMSKSANKFDYKDIIKKIANFEVIDRNILVKLINKVEVSKDKQIFITYNFCIPKLLSKNGVNTAS